MIQQNSGYEIDSLPYRKLGFCLGLLFRTLPKGKEILEIAQSTDGCFEIVSEKEIIEGWKELNRQGIYIEPTSALLSKQSIGLQIEVS